LTQIILPQLFPYVILRAAGAPLQPFAELRAEGALAALHAIQAMRAELAETTLAACNRLSDEIAAFDDPRLRNRAVELKRALFNGRRVAPSTLAAVQPSLSEDTRARVDRCLALTRELADAEARAAAGFDDEKRVLRKQLAELSKQHVLQAGLVLSSRDLQRSLVEHYIANHDKLLRSRDVDTELGLLKYLSRLHAKTSPFSTFTTVTCLPARDDAAKRWNDVPGAPSIRSDVRLNTLLHRLIQAVLIAQPEIWPVLPVRVNPTLRLEEGQYLFLTSSNNVEAFQRVEPDPALDLLLELIPPPSEMSCTDLGAALQQHGVEAESDEMVGFLRQLLDYGILEFNFNVSGVDPDWDLALAARLRTFAAPPEVITPYLELLAHLRQAAVQYAAADIPGRIAIANAAHARLKEFFAARAPAPAPAPEVPAETPPPEAPPSETPPEAEESAAEDEPFRHQYSTAFLMRPEGIFLEDTTLELDGAVEAAPFRRFAETAFRVLKSVPRQLGGGSELDMMSAYLKSKWADQAVPLLTFYEGYSRDVRLPQARRRAAPETPPETPPVLPPEVEARMQMRDPWTAEFVARVTEKLAGSPSSLALIAADLPEVAEADLAPPQRASVGMFVQPIAGGDGSIACAVLNGMFPGYGKLMGRFLHLAGPEMTEALREWNQSLAGDGELLAENRDAAFFNANLHPPMLPFEVWLPGAHGSLAADRQIRITDLVVTREPNGELALRSRAHGDGRVYVFDLGFQGAQGRSQLFQMLSMFTLPQHMGHRVLAAINHLAWRDKRTAEPRQLVMQPRVTFEDTLVLQRRCWYVPKAMLPKREPKEPDWRSFERIAEWRESLQMPAEVFVTLSPREVPRSPAARFKRDDHKPQYVSFENPFTVSLLERMVPRTDEWLKIEEMLPDSAQLGRVGPDRHVTEWVLQWYEGAAR
jgi:hypothetical protein